MLSDSADNIRSIACLSVPTKRISYIALITIPSTDPPTSHMVWVQTSCTTPHGRSCQGGRRRWHTPVRSRLHHQLRVDMYTKDSIAHIVDMPRCAHTHKHHDQLWFFLVQLGGANCVKLVARFNLIGSTQNT